MGALSQLLPFRSSPPRAHTVDHKSPGAPGLASMRLGVVTEGGSQFRERIFLLRDPARWVLAGRWGNSNCSYDGSDLAETFAQAPPPQHPPPPPIPYHTLEDSRSPLGTASYLGMAVSPWQDACNGKAPARGAQRTNSFLLGRRPWNGEPKGASERDGEGPALWNPGIRSGLEDRDPGLRAPRKAWGGAGQDAHQVSSSPPSPGLSPPGIDSVSSTRVM